MNMNMNMMHMYMFVTCTHTLSHLRVIAGAPTPAAVHMLLFAPEGSLFAAGFHQ